MFKFGKKKAKGAEAETEAEGEAPAVAEGEEASPDGEEGAPKKKKIPLLFIIIPAALVVLGGGGGAAFLLLKPKPAAAEAGEHGEEKGGHGEKKGGGHGEKKGGGHGEAKGGEGDAAAGVIAEGPDGVTFYTLPPLVTNIQSPDGRPTFLKLKLTLEMKDAGVAEQLQGDLPRLNDMFQGFLRELRPEELDGSAGNFALRAEILRRVNMIAAPGKVDAVLIEEMVVQ